MQDVTVDKRRAQILERVVEGVVDLCFEAGVRVVRDGFGKVVPTERGKSLDRCECSVTHSGHVAHLV